MKPSKSQMLPPHAQVVSPRLVSVRKNICRNCPNKCQLYLEHKIVFEDPSASCPVEWKGAWPVVLDGFIPNHVPIADLQVRKLKAWRLKLWSELHLRALQHVGNADDTAWLVGYFGTRMKLPGCNCIKQWANLIYENPPRWDDYFNWSVEAHNTIRKRLNKRPVDVDTARKFWSTYPPPPLPHPTK